MAYPDIASRGGCPAPFISGSLFPADEGFISGRLCQNLTETLSCCLPCPLTDWVYPDYFNTMTTAANWVCVASAACCLFLLLSWAVLPVDKTYRHYLSICLTIAVFIMNLGFVVPLAAEPEQCYNDITPHSMKSSKVCGASGAFLLLGGWAGVMWVFLRSLSLHLQICWQVVVGRNFMIFAQAAGWGIPIIGIVVALVFSVIIQFATFGYCIKVYLASLADNSASTEGSSLPQYSQSIRTMTPRQAYRRVRRVISLQWRGIAIVLIIIADVIFFSVVFVFQDNTVQAVHDDKTIAADWITCITLTKGDRSQCYDKAKNMVVNEATITAVLILLAMNGIWLLFLLGRWAMVLGWIDLVTSLGGRNKKEFVSVDARYDVKKDTRAYEMLSRDSSAVVTPVSPVKSPVVSPNSGRRTPDYFGQTARYQPPMRSFSSPRPPQTPPTWDARATYARPESRARPDGFEDMNPLGMNRI
uniref:G-protein coupled receptors family 2 profile 2 domain-containing protein n=1 Tax=Colletotrichum fructicola (strain Nara gc5) TaxID=1213859 RepID=L2G0B5_COLFN